jgi:glucokinase
MSDSVATAGGVVLAGDIGGTKTLLALFERTEGGLRALAERSFPSREHGSLEEIVRAFLASAPRVPISTGCFAVAGPVIDGRAKATNLPWEMEEGSLARAAGVPRVRLLNDLEGTAYGMLFLRPEEQHVLVAGTRPLLRGNVAVIAAGTGLGEAMLYFDGREHHPIASEGGHADFAPQGEREVALLAYLGRRDEGLASEPAELREALAAAPDPTPVISQRGLAGSDALCTEALDLFCRIYGAEAGNFALRFLAVGGVFLGGGIAPKILPALSGGSFLEAYTAKGRLGPLLQGIPVRVCLNPKAALLGAAHFAARG